MAISQFFIISPSGDVLLSRNLRNESTKNIDRFYKHMKEKGDLGPIFELDGLLYFFIKRSGLYFVITTKYVTSPSYILELLQKITNHLKDFIGILNEESIRNNFVLAYEILDEALDYGYVQCMDINQLKQKIYNTSTVSMSSNVNQPLNKNVQLKPMISGNRNMVPSVVSNKSLINPDNKNEIFVDILEKVSVKMTANETKYTVEGQIQIKSYLKGFPKIELYLNPELNIQLSNSPRITASSVGESERNATSTDRSSAYTERGGEKVVNNCTFDETVDVSKLEYEKVLSFVPKEGEYNLMTYRVSGYIDLPFKILPTLTITENKANLVIKVMSFLNVEINSFFLVTCKLPTSVKNINMTLSPKYFNQVCDHKLDDNTVYWNVKKIQGYNEVELNCDLVFNTSNLNRKQFGPINMMFEIPLYNVSNLKIKYLNILYNSNYIKSSKWVRYLTISNSYIYRF